MPSGGDGSRPAHREASLTALATACEGPEGVTSMRRSICGALVSLLFLVVGARGAVADDVVVGSCPSPCTRPPSTSAHNQVLGMRAEPYPHYGLPGVVLRGGKRGRILIIDASMSNVTPVVPITFQMAPRVSGNLPPDSLQSASVDCGGTGAITPPEHCSATGHWWLDLDAHPELINAPISIALTVGTQYQGAQAPVLAITLSARLEKK